MKGKIAHFFYRIYAWLDWLIHRLDLQPLPPHADVYIICGEYGHREQYCPNRVALGIPLTQDSE